jgi:hypothetical protein
MLPKMSSKCAITMPSIPTTMIEIIVGTAGLKIGKEFFCVPSDSVDITGLLSFIIIEPYS